MVEASLVVLEDPQARDASGEPFSRVLAIVPGNAEQHADTRVDLADDLAVHDHARRRDALDDGPQLREVFDALVVVLRAGLQRAGQLVVAVRLGVAA